MEIKRYITIQAVKTRKDIIVPIWDERLQFSISEDVGERFYFENRYYYNTIECIYDLETKKISTGIEIDHIPSETEFQKGETVYYEISHRSLSESKIVDIKFEKFESVISKGRDIDIYYKKHLDLKDLSDDYIYCLKIFKPTYILENGEEIEYEYKLNHKK